MLSTDAGTTHLEAVTVTRIYFLSILIEYITVLKCHTVLNRYLSDGTGLYLDEQIPTVIGHCMLQYIHQIHYPHQSSA